MAFSIPAGKQTSKISITNLSLPHPILASDVWGKQKEQPALLSLHLTLRGLGFSSAASSDKLDDSTIHYGTLAKKIRNSCTAGMLLGELVFGTKSVVDEKARKATGKFIVSESRTEIGLCKASMFGEEARLVRVVRYREDGSTEESRWGFEVKAMKVMVLVGVNGYERQARQPLVVDFGVWFAGHEIHFEALFGLENEVVNIIQNTTFETLETLVEHLISELRKKVLDTAFPGSQIQLRISKPRAIAFADAPSVEVIRDIP